MKTVAPDQCRERVRSHYWPVGSVVLRCDITPAWYSRAIAATQRKALKDLDPNLPLDSARWTHCGVICGEDKVGHLTFPHAVVETWAEFGKGYEFSVIIADNADVCGLGLLAHYTRSDATLEVKYDLGDLFDYLLKWNWKVFAHRKYLRIFGKRGRHVCSTRIVENHRRSGIFLMNSVDVWGYYPARLDISVLWRHIDTDTFTVA